MYMYMQTFIQKFFVGGGNSEPCCWLVHTCTCTCTMYIVIILISSLRGFYIEFFVELWGMGGGENPSATPPRYETLTDMYVHVHVHVTTCSMHVFK